jgi:myo-inositol-1-phosphate synthase
MSKVGVLFIGALGYIATTVVAGSLALRKSLCKRTGMVTDLDIFSGLRLIEPDDIVFGGWDIRPGSPLESASTFFRNNQMLDPGIVSGIEDELNALSVNFFPGTARSCGRTIERMAEKSASGECTLRALVDKLRHDINSFRNNNRLKDVLVFNLSSTEPPLNLQHCHTELSAFEDLIGNNRCEAVRASTLYAYAAILERCPYINFTPSNAALIPALIKLAEEKDVPVMGDDGKTGETLVKSALIPMFRYRNLEVLSWEGFNILGNMDGRVLDDPENRESKILTKEQVIGNILGYAPHSKVHINYVPSLDDQKTAWNFIHFKGFLGTKMSLQFIWQGYDSILAAPLVLDLIRLMELAKRRGESGIMHHLASFFKAPLGVNEYRLSEQFRMLTNYLNQVNKT